MFKFVKDREQELLLLDFCVRQAKYIKELIPVLEALEDTIKANGVIHKGKRLSRLKTIKDLNLELASMKKWYIAHKQEPANLHDTRRYSFRKGISDNRINLYGSEKKNNE